MAVSIKREAYPLEPCAVVTIERSPHVVEDGVPMPSRSSAAPLILLHG
jgi:hypothetical protein